LNLDVCLGKIGLIDDKLNIGELILNEFLKDRDVDIFWNGIMDI